MKNHSSFISLQGDSEVEVSQLSVRLKATGTEAVEAKLHTNNSQRQKIDTNPPFVYDGFLQESWRFKFEWWDQKIAFFFVVPFLNETTGPEIISRISMSAKWEAPTARAHSVELASVSWILCSAEMRG